MCTLEKIMNLFFYENSKIKNKKTSKIDFIYDRSHIIRPTRARALHADVVPHKFMCCPNTFYVWRIFAQSSVLCICICMRQKKGNEVLNWETEHTQRILNGICTNGSGNIVFTSTQQDQTKNRPNIKNLCFLLQKSVVTSLFFPLLFSLLEI